MIFIVDASQMVGEFKSFCYNRNVHHESWYRECYFLPPSHLVWYEDSLKFQEAGFLIESFY